MDRGSGKRKISAPRINDEYVDLGSVLNPGKRRIRRHEEGSAEDTGSDEGGAGRRDKENIVKAELSYGLTHFLHADATNSSVFSASADVHQHYHHILSGTELLHSVGALDVSQLTSAAMSVVHSHLGNGQTQPQPQADTLPSVGAQHAGASPKQHMVPQVGLTGSVHALDNDGQASGLGHQVEQPPELDPQVQVQMAMLAGQQVIPTTYATLPQVVPLQDNTHARRLMALGRKYADINAQALDALLDAARQQNNTMTVYIQMPQLTTDLAASAADLLPEGIPPDGCEAAPLEIPRTALVHHLREYICRTSGHYIHPAMQVLRHPLSGEELQGIRQLSSYGIGDGAVITLELAAANQDAYHQCVSGLEGSYTAALNAVPEGGQRPPVAPRKKFTAEEMRALTEGVRLFGYSWSTIKSHFGEELKERTQVNLKDKWRNLSKGANTQWKDERAPLPPDLKDMVRAVVASHPHSTSTSRQTVGQQSSAAIAAAQAATVAGLVGAAPRPLLLGASPADQANGGGAGSALHHQSHHHHHHHDAGLSVALQQHGMMPVDCSSGVAAGQGLGRHLELDGLDLAHMGGELSSLEASAAVAAAAASVAGHDAMPSACAVAAAAVHHASQLAAVYGMDSLSQQ